MIITFEPDVAEGAVDAAIALARAYAGVTPRTHVIQGTIHKITELYLIGQTQTVPTEPFEKLAGVRRVVRVSDKYRVIGRHGGKRGETVGFAYNGVKFDESSVLVFAGLCAVDTREHVTAVCAALREAGVATTRMGAYKPRTSPYDFQGLGKECLPWVFEICGRHGIRVVAMEVTDARHVDEIRAALAESGDATGVMLQIGTRNAQNFELLKQVGQQRQFPVLFKRGMGITLEESLNAAEYIASE
ncbi:MAG TPA: 3-deoxy-7-phosphoheptulonate synthase, partial [Planctomycetota bacterium]|nr:3-deoxy-7-phosphoheptulonate synthase [Planctomycetota bacterium]